MESSPLLPQTRRALECYPKIMILQLFVDSDNAYLRHMYDTAAHIHNEKVAAVGDGAVCDAGFDLYAPEALPVVDAGNSPALYRVDHRVKCAAQMVARDPSNVCRLVNASPTGFLMMPRSSIVKTSYRLANSVGVIDAGYRGNLIAVFDKPYVSPINDDIRQYDRLVQICAGDLCPILVEIVEDVAALGRGWSSARGDGGFGSTGRGAAAAAEPVPAQTFGEQVCEIMEALIDAEKGL